MLLGDKYTASKNYRGLYYYNRKPITSNDLHEQYDLLYTKNRIFTDSLLGSGVISEIILSNMSGSIILEDPVALLIEGDTVLINIDNASGEMPVILSKNDTVVDKGVLCVVGWYQLLTDSSVIRSYGGVNNRILPNDIADDVLGLVSTRYQFRWDTVVIPASDIENNDFNFSMKRRDSQGVALSGSLNVRVDNKVDNIFLANKPSSDMEYAESTLYIIPLFSYEIDSSTGNIINVIPTNPISISGGNSLNIINTTDTPATDTPVIWYNPTDNKFKIYVPGVGFSATSPDVSYISLKNSIKVTSTSTKTYSIGISEYSSEDSLVVLYEGIYLEEGTHYTLDKDNKKITLVDFVTAKDEVITFIVNKLKLVY